MLFSHSALQAHSHQLHNPVQTAGQGSELRRDPGLTVFHLGSSDCTSESAWLRASLSFFSFCKMCSSHSAWST